MEDIFEKLAAAKEACLDFALCIAVNTKGSVPRAAGAKMMVYADGKIFGTIGGGRIEKLVIDDALNTLQTRRPILIHYDLLKQLQMSCGGSMDIYIEPMMRKNKLYIFGAGHTGLALAKRAIDFDFEITMIDDRKNYLDEINIAGLHKIYGDFKKVLPTLAFDNSTYITIMTYNHPSDREVLSYCLNKQHAYIGMMGSKRKVEMTKKMLIDEGIGSEETLTKVDMPMGLEIGADGPEEISISILAKILSVKNKTKAK